MTSLFLMTIKSLNGFGENKLYKATQWCIYIVQSPGPVHTIEPFRYLLQQCYYHNRYCSQRQRVISYLYQYIFKKQVRVFQINQWIWEVRLSFGGEGIKIFVWGELAMTKKGWFRCICPKKVLLQVNFCSVNSTNLLMMLFLVYDFDFLKLK